MNYFEVNPGGNITAIIRGDYGQKDRVAMAKKILEQNKNIEQVGFWMESKKASGRLEMAGGEFCGNATRALAYLVANESAEDVFYLESSGLERPIQCQINNNDVQIRLPRGAVVPIANLSRFTIVNLPGISHIVTQLKIDKADTIALLQKFNLLIMPAAGVISYQINNNEITIKPIVWVRLTETIYEETACASGSLAVALTLSNEVKNNLFVIKQPSGYSLTVRLDENYMTLAGPVIEATIKRIK